MAVPKKRQSRSRSRLRRANWKLTAPGYVKCSHCREPKRQHQVCPECGYYRGRQVVAVTQDEE